LVARVVNVDCANEVKPLAPTDVTQHDIVNEQFTIADGLDRDELTGPDARCHGVATGPKLHGFAAL
jgi:hypothetical protein